MKIFESFDEREKAVENAAGNLAFNVFWCLMLITLIIIFSIIGARPSEYEMTLLFFFIIYDMIAALCVKYFYCWTHDINKKILIVKFIRALMGSFIFVLVIIFLIIFITEEIM